MKTIIHVNQHNIRSNIKNETKLPVLTIKNYKSNKYSNEVEVKDHNGNLLGRIVYSPDKPLSCGARVWIEFYSEHVELDFQSTDSKLICNKNCKTKGE